MQKRPLTLKPLDAKATAAKASGPRSVAQGLVGWWKFDEIQGATAADASPNHLDGHLLGQLRWAPSQGRFGGALELDGTRSFVDCGGPEDFDFREAMTLSVWLKVRRGDKQTLALVTKGNNTWQLQFTGEKRQLNFALTGPQTTGANKGRPPSVKSKRPVEEGQWHHVVGVYDGQRVFLYLDGELEETVTASGLIAVNTEPVMIGQDSMAPSHAFDGWIDDVRLYNRGLSAEEVRTLYGGGANVKQAAR